MLLDPCQRVPAALPVPVWCQVSAGQPAQGAAVQPAQGAAGQPAQGPA